MRHRHPRSTTFRTIWTLGLTAAVLLLLGLACGRKGDPRPRSDVSNEVARPPATAPATSGR